MNYKNEILEIEKKVSKPLVEFKGIEKTYVLGSQEITALKEINFSLWAGEFLAITGPSGSGKSTLLNLLSLIDTPTRGQIEYLGVDVSTMTDDELTRFRNKKIGIVFQNYNLIPVFNAVENVAFALQAQSVSKTESIDKAAQLLEEVGLKDFLHHRPANLSGGQRQRVAIARALVTHPEIIIADEPTAALDSKTGIDIINLMKKLNKSKGTTFIFSTHDPKIIDQVDNIIKIEDGVIIGKPTPQN